MPPRRGRRRLLIALLATVAVLAVALTAVLLTLGDDPPGAADAEPAAPNAAAAEHTTTAAPAPEQVVKPAEVPALLLGAGELGTLLGSGPLIQNVSGQGTWLDTATDNPACGGVTDPALAQAYDGSGYLSMEVRQFRDNPSDYYHLSVTETASAYPSTSAARAYVDTEKSRWGKCASKTVVKTIEGKDTRMFVGQPNQRDGAVTVTTMIEGLDGWGCQHTLRSQRNVVVDVAVCSYAAGGTFGDTLADRIAARVAPA
jgi:serine/threonine-protein kinase